MATTSEMLSDPAYIEYRKSIQDQNALLGTGGGLLTTGLQTAAATNPVTMGAYIGGLALGRHWGTNEGNAYRKRMMEAMELKKALETPIVGMTGDEAWNLVNDALPKKLQEENPVNVWLRQFQGNNPQAIQTESTYLTDPQLAQKQFAQNNGQVATALFPSVSRQGNQNPYGLKQNYFPYPTSGNPSLDLTVNSNSNERVGRTIFGKTSQQMASQAMGGYMPPPNVPKLNWQPRDSYLPYEIVSTSTTPLLKTPDTWKLVKRGEW